MDRQKLKYRKRVRRHLHVRRRVRGGSRRPRLSVFRSLNHIYAQVINDDEGRTLCAASSLDPDVRKIVANGGNRKAAEAVGVRLALLARQAGVEAVVFDRGHAKFHGRVKALAEAARKGGLKF